MLREETLRDSVAARKRFRTLGRLLFEAKCSCDERVHVVVVVVEIRPAMQEGLRVLYLG